MLPENLVVPAAIVILPAPLKLPPKLVIKLLLIVKLLPVFNVPAAKVKLALPPMLADALAPTVKLFVNDRVCDVLNMPPFKFKVPLLNGVVVFDKLNVPAVKVVTPA